MWGGCNTYRYRTMRGRGSKPIHTHLLRRSFSQQWWLCALLWAAPAPHWVAHPQTSLFLCPVPARVPWQWIKFNSTLNADKSLCVWRVQRKDKVGVQCTNMCISSSRDSSLLLPPINTILPFSMRDAVCTKRALGVGPLILGYSHLNEPASNVSKWKDNV